MDIDINEYLTEEQKQEIAIQEWRKLVRADMVERFKDNHTDVVKNYERVISNAVYNYLEKEIDSLLGTDHKEFIQKRVEKTIKVEDYRFSLFRKSNAWDRERSPGQQILIDAVNKHRDLIYKKVEEHIQSLTKTEILGGIDEVLEKIIKDKFK